MKRPPKKDDTLEIRLPQETKQAFMDRCRAEGRSASQAVREFIEQHLARPLSKKEPPMPTRPILAYAAAAAVIAVGLVGVTAAPSRAAPDLQAIFANLDTNKDSLITETEFAATQAMMMVMRADGPPPAATVQDFVLPVAGPPHPLPGGEVAATPDQRSAMTAAIFAEIDADKSGGVGFDEFAGYHRSILKRSFDTLDANRDGVITADEAKRPLTPAGPGRLSIAGAQNLFAQLDKNRDGAVTEQEFGDLP